MIHMSAYRFYDETNESIVCNDLIDLFDILHKSLLNNENECEPQAIKAFCLEVLKDIERYEEYFNILYENHSIWMLDLEGFAVVHRKFTKIYNKGLKLKDSQMLREDDISKYMDSIHHQILKTLFENLDIMEKFLLEKPGQYFTRDESLLFQASFNDIRLLDESCHDIIKYIDEGQGAIEKGDGY